MFSIEPAGWVEDQDVRRGSNDSSVANAGPASKSIKETAWRPAIRASQAEQIRRRRERPCEARGASVVEPHHLLLHLRSKQGVEPDNPPEAKC